MFRGSPAGLIEAARNHVWTLTMNGLDKPNHQMTVVSMMHLVEGIQYRLVGPDAEGYAQAQPVQPGLEDGYVWLMKAAGQEVDA